MSNLTCCGVLLNSETYKYHFNNRHLKQGKLIPCPLCSLTFKTLNDFENHYNTKHSKEAIHLTSKSNASNSSFSEMQFYSTINRLPNSKNVWANNNKPQSNQPIEYVNTSTFQAADSNNLTNFIPPPYAFESLSDDIAVNEVELDFNEDQPFQRLSDQPSFLDNSELTDFQKDLLKSMKNVKNSETINFNALSKAFEECSKVFFKHFNNKTINKYDMQDANRVIKSRYLFDNIEIPVLNIVYDVEGGQCFYSSIEKIIMSYLNERKIFDLIVKRKRKIQSENTCILEDPLDCPHVKEVEAKLADDEIIIYFDIYYDGFNLSSRGVQSIGMEVIYLSIANLPYNQQSKRNSIGCIGITDSNVLKKIGFRKFFEPIVNELKNLTKKTIDFNGFKIKFKFLSVKSDNKGANQMIIDVAQSFNSDSCKYCDIHYRDLKQKRFGNKRELSNRHVFYGVEHQCLSLYAPDPFHDIHEGLIEKIFSVFLKYHISPNQVEELNKSVQTLNQQFNQFKLNLSSFKINRTNLSGTGVQKFHFFQIFSLLNSFVRTSSDNYKIFYLARIIVDFVMSPKLNQNDLNFFEKIVHKFIELFKELYPNETVVFKMHYLEHYAEIILEFGPLIFSSTLRYERVHQKLIRSVSGSNNYKNLVKSISKNFIFDLSTSISEKKIKKTHSSFKTVDPIYQNYISWLGECEVLELKSVIVNGMKLKENFFYVYKETSNNGFPVFIKIVQILTCADLVFVIGRLAQSTSFDPKTYSFEIKLTSNLLKFNFESLWYYEPLIFYRCNQFEEVRILKTFHLPFQNSHHYLLNWLNIDWMNYQIQK